MDMSNDALSTVYGHVRNGAFRDSLTDAERFGKQGAAAGVTASPSRVKGRARRKVTQPEDDDSSKRRCVSTACIACRKRKSKCDGNTPACAACSQVYNTECIYDPNSDHRRKGVYKNDTDHLKTKDTTLHTLIQAILNYSEEDVPGLVQDIRTCESLDDVAERIIAKEQGIDLNELDEDDTTQILPSTATFESNLYAKLGDLRLDEGAMRYIGGTSNLIHVGEPDDVSLYGDQYPQQENAITSWTNVTKDTKLITHLLNMYFTWHYTYFATLSKSLFYRDFQLGRPPAGIKRTQYCSPILVNAMLALGCHFTAHAGARDIPGDSATAGDHFFREAKRLLTEDDVLELPRLTTVQALALMSVREAGCGREAKGWVYSGMSFRMSQDMGLHLDTAQLANNSFVSADEAEDDARKITFWGCFLFDKCWSNYLGRLPQLPRSIVTTAKFEVFPEEDAADWMPYTDSGFTVAHSQPARTRAVSLEIAKLCEISNDLMQNFYNPTDMDKVKGKQSELKKLSDIHTRLETWRRELPKEFEPKEGGLSSVLVMHMFFQLLFIHLFRPFLKYTQSTSPLPSNVSPRKLCTQAAATISKLLRLYKRSHGLRQICNIAVYIAHSACTIHLLNLPDKNARRDIIHGVKHLEEIAEGWLCARRSLGILSLLAIRWDVQLPYECETVLARTDAKFGPYKRDGQSPSTELKHTIRPGGNYYNNMQQNGVSQTASQQHALTSASPITSQPHGSYLHGSSYAPLTTSPATTAAATATGYTITSVPSEIFATPLSNASMSLHSAAQSHYIEHNNNNQATEVLPTPRSETSPSAMFGGIEQLLRDSQDWAYKDQAQLGTGFGNWNVLDDDSAAWTSGTRQSLGNASAAVQHNNGISNSKAAQQQQDLPLSAGRTTMESSPTFATKTPSSVSGRVGELRTTTTSDDWTTNQRAAAGVAATSMYNTMMSYNEDEWYQ